MIGNVEHYTTLTVALMTISFCLCQVHAESRSCSLLARPHRNGFCGEKLAMAHRNLCFLIRQSYPEFFPIVKRSVPRTLDGSTDHSEAVMVDPDLGSYSLTSYKHNEEATSSPGGFSNILISSMAPQDVPEYPSKSYPGSAFIDMLQKRAPRTKRSLVCECCYSPCTVRTMARYC